MTELGVHHVIIAVGISGIIGLICHIIRGAVNVYPDKISDSAFVNITVSEDYSFTDYLFGIEFDNYGFYELYSLKNLRITVMYSMISCFVIMIIDVNTGMAVAELLNTSFEIIRDYLAHRIDVIKALYFN